MEQTEKPIFEAKEIHKSFTRPQVQKILKGISLQVNPGESFAITGSSGEGKSTLLHILGTLDTPTSGEIIVAGQRVSRLNHNMIRQKYLGFIFQSFHLLQDYTALENVLMPAMIARKSTARGSEAYERGCALLESVGLSHRIYHSSKLLSGGEKQRVGIARALCNDPDLILADEPTGNLDHKTSSQIHEILMRLTQEENKALILVTHDHELASLCSHRCHLQDGLIQ